MFSKEILQIFFCGFAPSREADHDCRRQFVLVRQQLVVMWMISRWNRGVVDHAFGAHHLLNLKQYGVMVPRRRKLIGPTCRRRFFFSAEGRGGEIRRALFILRDVED